MMRLIYSLALVAATALAVAQVRPEPTSEDWKWLDAHYDEVFEGLMPTDAPDTLLVYRSFRGLDVLERSFVVGYDPVGQIDKNRLVAAVMLATGRPIAQQLLDAHLRDRAASAVSIQSQLSYRRLALNSSTCRQLRVQMDQLSEIAIPIPKRDLIPAHPVLHRFVIKMADRIDATLIDDKSPLVRWANRTMDVLLACASSSR